MAMTIAWYLRSNEYICVGCGGWNADESAFSEEIDYAIDNEDIGSVPDDIVCRECGEIIIEHHD